MVNKEEFIEIVKNSFSYANVCKLIGISPVGSNYITVKKYIKLYDINIDHFTGQGWNTGNNYKYNGKKIISLDEILNGYHPNYKMNSLKTRLIKNGLKEHKCEKCGIIKWNDKKISLHIHHVDGDNTNHKLYNLEILCPNCHSQTENYGTKNKNKNNYSRLDLLNAIYESENYTEIKKKLNLSKNGDNNFIKNILFEYNVKLIEKDKIKNIIELENDVIILPKPINYCECGKEIKRASKRCPSCDKIKQRKVKDRPSVDELILMIKESSLEAVGRKYGVSGNAVKKWIK